LWDSGIGKGLLLGVLLMTGKDLMWNQTTYTLTGFYVLRRLAPIIVSLILFTTDFALNKYITFMLLYCVFYNDFSSNLFFHEFLNVFAIDFLELNFLVSFFIFLLYDVYVAYLLVNQEVSGVEK